MKFSDAGIQDVSTSISITVTFEEMTDDDDEDESDKHLEARDRRYSCLKSANYHLSRASTSLMALVSVSSHSPRVKIPSPFTS